MSVDSDAMFFIGGRGDGSGGVATPGGCLKSWWDAKVVAVGAASALAALMGSDGAPIAVGDHADTTIDNNGGFTRYENATLASAAEVGMLLFTTAFTVIFTGHFEVTDVTGDFVTTNEAFSDPSQFDVFLGGAYGSHVQANHATGGVPDPIIDHQRFEIHSNFDEVLDGLVWLAMGSDTDNSWVKVYAYTSVPFDRTAGTWPVTLSSNTDSKKLFNLTTALENVSFEGFCLDQQHATGDECIYYGTTDPFRNVHFNDCKIQSLAATSEIQEIADAVGFGIQYNDCVFSQDAVTVRHSYMTDVHFFNCDFGSVTDELSANYHVAIAGGSVKHCTFAHKNLGVNVTPLTATPRLVIIENNVFWDFDDRAVYISGANASVSMHDNIVVGEDADSVGITWISGTFTESHNCYYARTGEVMTNPIYDSTNAAALSIDSTSIEADPLLADPANGDYSVLSASPCIGTARDDIGGGKHDMGAVAFWNVSSANYPEVGDVQVAVDYGYNDQFTGTLTFTEPGAPSFTVAAGTNAVTLTIDGDAGVTNEVVYKGSGDVGWVDGGNVVGDGDVVVSSLDNGVPYIFTVYSVDGAGNSSTPGVAVNVTLSAVSTNDIDAELDCMAVEQLEAQGEEVTYWPLGRGFRQIQAIVDRNFEGRTVVWVANDSVIGISSSEVDTGGDKIEIGRRIGKIAAKRKITNVGPQDAGMVRYDIADFNPENVRSE